MANSKYASTRETTNFARVSRIILGPCTGVLCALLTKEITPPTLLQKVKKYLASLPKRKQPSITKEQEWVIHHGSYSDFDITLLYFLLRNISTFPPHAKQWGNEPIPSDRSVSANIERIRLIRNKYGHFPHFSISDTDFNAKILEISSIIKVLENHLGTSTTYQDAVDEITNCCMDTDQEVKYINEFLDVYKKIQDISEETKRIENSCAPKNVKVLYEWDSCKWAEEDRVFLETHNFPVMLEQVRTQPYVTFVGGPGSGKTATARHIALILQKEGYEIFPINEIKQIEDYCNQTIPQVFVIDDVLGVFGLNELELHNIRKYKERLRDPINRNTKTLLTCREAVFRNELISDSVLFKKENTVLLQSKENKLNDDDKKNLLEKYSLDRDILTSDNLASSLSMFPLLCKLFSSEPKYKVYGNTFFISPFDCILKEMNSLKIHNKLQYASLVLLMANENKLSEKILDNENSGTKEKKSENMFAETKCSILRKCKVPHNTDNFKLIDALLEMEGTYTKTSDGEFIFIHDSMFEIIAYHFGRLFPELILQFASSNYIASHIKVDKDKGHKKRKIDCKEDEAFENDKLIRQNNERKPIPDLCIQLHEAQYTKLADRLFRDLQNEEFYDVFGNEALKSPPILQYFIEIMEQKSYENLYDLLLSEVKNSSKICKWEHEQKKIVGKNKRNINMKTRAHKCLINEILIDGRLRSIVKGISWVIFFGHHQILDNILIQMIQNEGDVDDLFLNSFNEGPQPNPNTDQDVTEEDDCLNQEIKSGSCKKTDHVEEDRRPDMNIDSDSEYSSDSDTYSDSYMYTDIDTDMDTDSEEASYLNTKRDDEADNVADSGPDSDTYSVTSFGIYNDLVIIEQCRLLCLGCFSGDLNTVQILLKHVNADALNEIVWPSTFLGFEENALSIACHYGYKDIVMELLEAGADANIYLYFETPLTNACINGRIGIVRALLEFGANVNKTNKMFTPLQYACKHGHSLIVEELIKARADVNLKVPLKDACLKGNLCIVRQLIKVKADVNLSHWGDTPLLYACTRGHFNVVKELLASGADVNQRSNYEACFLHKTFAERSPVTTACDGSFFNVLKLLLKSGAKIDPKDKVTLNFPCYWDYLITLKRLIEMESSFDLNDTNETSFIAECYRGHLGEVKEMIKCRADVNMKDGDKTPLIVACYKDHLHVVKELIEAGADVNLGNEFISPLQVACFSGHLSIVKELIKTEFADNEVSSVGKALMGACFFGHLSVVKELITCHAGVILKHGKDTLLKTACYMGHLNIVKELIEAGADVNQSDGNSTLLTAAYEGERYNVISELIKAGANVNQSNGHNSLLLAECEKGRCESVELVKTLIEAGADVNQSNGNKTPLTAALDNWHWKIVRELIKGGADVNQCDGNKTPLTTACETGRVKIVKALIEAGADVNQSDGTKTPLTTAFDIWDLKMVRELIKAGADDNQS